MEHVLMNKNELVINEIKVDSWECDRHWRSFVKPFIDWSLHRSSGVCIPKFNISIIISTIHCHLQSIHSLVLLIIITLIWLLLPLLLTIIFTHHHSISHHIFSPISHPLPPTPTHSPTTRSPPLPPSRYASYFLYWGCSSHGERHWFLN